MTIVDVATDRPHLGRRHVYVHDSRAYTAGQKLILGAGGAAANRLVAGVFSAAADCLLGFTVAAGTPSPLYEMRAGVPLVLPYCAEGYHEGGVGNTWRVYCDTATDVHVNAVLGDGEAHTNPSFDAETTAEHLGAPLQYHVDAATYLTASPTEIVPAVSGRRIRVLKAHLASTASNDLVSFLSASTTITKFHLGSTQPGIILPFNPLGWFETNAGEALNVEMSDSFGRVTVFAQEVAA